MEFKQWVENRYRHPVVLVLATPTVENACRRNGLDLIHMLRPFTSHPAELYARLGERGEAVAVRNFGIRLARPACVREVGGPQLLRHSRRLLHEHAAMELAYGEQLDTLICKELLLPQSGGVVPGPRLSDKSATQLLERTHPAWHTQFVKDYLNLVRCSYFDTIDHPVGCIYAASTQAIGGVDGVLREFREQQKQIGEIRHDMPCMDDDLHSYYLIIHDITEGPPIEEARRMLAAVQALYGHAYCALVKINAVVNPQDMKNMNPSIWIEANSPSLDIPSWTAVRAAQQQEQKQQQEGGGGGRGGGTESALLAGTVSSTSSNAPIENNNNNNNSILPTPKELNQSSIVSTNSGNSTTTSSSISSSLPVSLKFPRVHTIFGTWPNGVSKVTGCYMSPENVEEVRNVMFYYLSQCLFPFLERKLRILTVAVNEKRTTTFGKVAAWFRNKDEAKSRSECWVISRDGGPTKYLAGSLEMQMRRAGDLSLTLADYDAAINFYRMCRNEVLSTLSSREFNKPIIAACQEALGICDLLLGRLPLPSLTPWLTGGTASKSSGDCRLEIAQNDYVSCQIQTYAFRMSLLIYEYCRTRTPPALDRATAALLHVQRLGMTSNSKLYSAIVHEFLASTSIFMNPPQPAGMIIPAQIPNNYPIRSRIRQYARHTIIAGSAYLDDNLLESSLRCYLRALRVCSEVGRRGYWQLIYEHLHTLLAHMYYKLGNNARGIAMAAVAVSMGTPMYSNLKTGLRNFDAFWNRQRQVLSDLGYSLCPHMVVPSIIPGSIRVSINGFHCDTLTQQESQVISEEISEIEWRKMEDKLRIHYTENSVGSPRHYQNWREDLTKMQRGSINGGMRQYIMHLSEPLEITVTLRNTIGGDLTIEKLCLLYVARQHPEQLWKSASSQTVELKAGSSKSVTISFSPNEEGTYVIIGFCWKLMNLEGYYYFATEAYERSQDTNNNNNNNNNKESKIPVFEYAVEHPTPNIDSPANLEIQVGPPQAWVTAKLEPELPTIMRDGEYYRTSLILTNGSSHRGARSITLQRSPQNAHIVWFETFGLERNLDINATFVLKEPLKPKESITLPIIIQAQHSRETLSRCRNNLFLLIGYIAETVNEKENTISVTSPHSTNTNNNFPYIRLHRFIRRVAVKPTLQISSKVLPPANATMAAAVLINAKHVSDNKEPPLRVSRMIIIHRPRWSVSPTYLGHILEENAVECIVPPGGALYIPLNVVSETPKSGIIQSSNINSANINVKEKDNVGLVEETCISLTSALPSPSKCKLVEANIGTSISESEINMYFMQCSFRGPGIIGEVKIREGLSFYLDKGKSLTSPVTNIDANENSQIEKNQQYSKNNNFETLLTTLEPFTPICAVLAWVIEENGQTYSGQLFHFIDPVDFLRSTNNLVTETHEQLQEHLCNSLIKNSSLHPGHGAVFYYLQVPDIVESTLSLPDSVLIPVKMHCRSLSAHPLLITVRTTTPNNFHNENNSLSSPIPLVFVGKTACTFLLLPYENYIIEFTACAFAPGLVQCNNFKLNAVALKFPKQFKNLLRTGMSRGALLEIMNEGTNNCILNQSTEVVASTTLGEVNNNNNNNSFFITAVNNSNSSFLTRHHLEDISNLISDDIHTFIIGHNAAVMTRAVFTSSTEQSIHDATAKIATRKQMYKEDIKSYETKYADFTNHKLNFNNNNNNSSGVVNAPGIDVELTVYRPIAHCIDETNTTDMNIISSSQGDFLVLHSSANNNNNNNNNIVRIGSMTSLSPERSTLPTRVSSVLTFDVAGNDIQHEFGNLTATSSPNNELLQRPTVAPLSNSSETSSSSLSTNDERN